MQDTEKRHLSESEVIDFRKGAKMAQSNEQIVCRGTLKGHNGWVTQIATTPNFPDMILSASRGKYQHSNVSHCKPTIGLVGLHVILKVYIQARLRELNTIKYLLVD